MTIAVYSLIMLAVAFNTFAQLALKAGMSHIGQFAFSWHNLFPITLQVATSPWIIAGTATYVGSMIVWLMVLSRLPVSIAYPMSSLGYITSAIAAYFLLGDNLTPVRIVGIVIIIFGVFLVARS